MKKLKLFIILFVLCLIPNFKVSASSATISVTSTKTRVIVGETVTVTVKISSSDSLGSWSFDVAPSSNLSLVNSSFGGLYIVDFVSNDSTKSKSYTFTFKANSSGTATVSIKNSSVIGYNELTMSVTNGSKTFNLITQSELEATYSKNNYLKSLSVDGYDLEPTFSKDTLEYSIQLPNGTESILVKASKEDDTASIKGTGNISLNEGSNLVEVVVTAQNGSTRTYTINANVQELNPIEVTLSNETYTVIRKQELMPQASIYYVESTVKINDEDVPCYYNEATSITLVGLKNNMGETKLYIYDNGEFLPYEELTFNQLSIKMLEMDETIIPNGYIKAKIEINGKTVLAYQKENSDFYLIYGLNLETGNKNLYKYDPLENTLQRYLPESENNNIYNYIIIGLFSFIVLSYLIFILLITKNNKKAKQIENTMKIDIGKIKEVKLEESGQLDDTKSEKTKKKKKNKKTDINN
jgi:hypothetical protein